MMKRKVALLMTTVMLATSVFPAGITAYAEEAVPTSEVAVEATLDETLEESADTSAVDGDVNVPDENAGTEVDSAQAGEDVISAEDEMIADDMAQDALTEDDSQATPVVADGDVIVSDVEVVDEASTVDANAGTQDGQSKENAIPLIEGEEELVRIGNDGVYYSFTPTESGSYTMISFAEEGIYPFVQQLDEIEEDYIYCPYNNFKRRYDLEEDKTYHFYIYKNTDGVDAEFSIGIYKTSSLELTGITMKEKAPVFVYGIDSFPLYLKKLENQDMTFSYKTGISETVKLSSLWDDDDEVYRDKYYNEVEFMVDGSYVEMDDPYALVVKDDYKLSVEGAGNTGISFNVSDIDDVEKEAGVTPISGNQISLTQKEGMSYYKFSISSQSGNYVIRRSQGEGIYIVLKSEMQSQYHWQSEEMKAAKRYIEADEVCYIAIPDVQENETLSIGESEVIEKIEFENTIQEQNVSEVFEGGLEYSIKITYDNNETETISGQHGELPYLQARNGENLYVSYSSGGKPVDCNSEKILIGSVTLTITPDDVEKEATYDFTIRNDFDEDKNLKNIVIEDANNVAKDQYLFKITEPGEYKWWNENEEDGWYEVNLYNLKDGYMEKRICYMNTPFTVWEVAYIDASNCIGDTISFEKGNAIEALSAQPNSLQFVEGKYSLDEDGDEVYIDLSGISVKIIYKDGSSQSVSLLDYEDSYGHYIYYDLYKAKGNLPDYDEWVSRYEEVPAGSYILEIYVENTDCSCYVPITVVHDWRTWTTSKKADINSPETQTSKCAHCGTIGSRTIGSKLAPVLTLTANKLTMKTKQSTSKFKVEAMAAGDALVSVTSNNTKLLKVSNVSPNGTFKLKAQNKTGTAKLTITLKSGTSKTIKVKIQKAKVNTTKIKVASKKLTLSKKQKYNLATVVTPVTSYDKVKYTSSNKKVATVSKKGQVTAKNKGSATITVKSGKKSVKVKVTVK